MNNQKYIRKKQKEITELVTNKFSNYYLTGGTALALYYNHRFSDDLDFFSQKYNDFDPKEIMDYISKKTKFDYTFIHQNNDSKFVQMTVYNLHLNKSELIKIDFVSDYIDNVNKIHNGVHSVEDIYRRKIYAAIGIKNMDDISGRTMATGRQSYKDCFDLHYLSSNYEPLSQFFPKHFGTDDVPKLMYWYKSFNRTDLKINLMELGDHIDSRKVIENLDKTILNELPKEINRQAGFEFEL